MKIFNVCLCKWTIALASICCFWGHELEAAKSYSSRVAINRTANVAVAVWTTEQSTYRSVMVSTWSGGSWSSAVMMSAVGEDALHPLVAVDASGNAIVIWSTFNAVQGVEALNAAQLPFGGSWTTPIQISSSSENVLRVPPILDVPPYQLITNDAGEALAVWISEIGNDLLVRTSTFSLGTWSAPISLSP
jgi:hypothetical protein